MTGGAAIRHDRTQYGGKEAVPQGKPRENGEIGSADGALNIGGRIDYTAVLVDFEMHMGAGGTSG